MNRCATKTGKMVFFCLIIVLNMAEQDIKDALVIYFTCGVQRHCAAAAAAAAAAAPVHWLAVPPIV